jgi:PhoH-like ATPase
MIVTTAASDLTDGIGFLPGTEEEKMLPWLGAFTDNLEVLLTDPEDDMCAKELTISHTASRYMQFKSINFMRGRSFQNTFVVVDEAQNLTPHQIKTLVTRVGEGSKIVLLGDLDQIDNKFLTVYSSGLTHVIENMMGSDYMGHVELKGSPRSVLAEDAAIRL